MRLGRLLIVVLLACGALAFDSARRDEPVAEAFNARNITLWQPGPLGPIIVFGDSVLLGSQLYGPTLPEQLAARGWGPIRFIAGTGFNTGLPTRPGAELGSLTTWVGDFAAPPWNTAPWVVNLGSNDSFQCRATDVACMRRPVVHVLDALGPGRRVWWPQMTLETFRSTEQWSWNTALAQLASERANLDTWDWPTEMASGPYRSNDNIHLTPDGYRARSARMAQVITARLGQGGPSGQAPAALPAGVDEPSGFVPVPQVRLADTRTDDTPIGGRRTTGDVLRVELGDTVPEGTTAVALHVAAVATRSAGFLSVAPCGADVDASSVNFLDGTTRGGPAVSRVGPDGDVCVSVVGDAHVVVDLQGAFHPDHPDALGFDPLPTPRRLHDTRQTGRRSEIRLDAPPGADAVAINLTTVNQSAPGLLTAAPCDAEPTVASLNYLADPVIASSAMVEVGDDGTFCVRSTSSVDVVVDLTGSFSAGGDLRFVPVVPTRMLDTRIGTGGWGTLHGSGQTVDVRVAPADAAAVTGTITIVRPLWPAFLTGAPCGTVPPTSSVNAVTSGVAANTLTTGVAAGRLCISASSGTHTLFDTVGWWVD